MALDAAASGSGDPGRDGGGGGAARGARGEEAQGAAGARGAGPSSERGGEPRGEAARGEALEHAAHAPRELRAQGGRPVPRGKGRVRCAALPPQQHARHHGAPPALAPRLTRPGLERLPRARARRPPLQQLPAPLQNPRRPVRCNPSRERRPQHAPVAPRLVHPHAHALPRGGPHVLDPRRESDASARGAAERGDARRTPQQRCETRGAGRPRGKCRARQRAAGACGEGPRAGCKLCAGTRRVGPRSERACGAELREARSRAAQQRAAPRGARRVRAPAVERACRRPLSRATRARALEELRRRRSGQLTAACSLPGAAIQASRR